MSIIDKPIVKTLMLKGEKGDPGDLDSTAIVDNLTTNDSTKVLSAKQGKILNESKTNVYDTLADMKSDTSLKVGMTAQTLGHYGVNDGGGATYKITDTESQSEYQEELYNELYASLIIEDVINVKQRGERLMQQAL